MKSKYYKICKIFTIVGIFLCAGLASNIVAISDNTPYQENEIQNQQVPDKQEQEYWALLVAVGLYADDPQQNRPLMLEEVDDFYELLVDSPGWEEDHIKVIKGKDATVTNIIKGLRWLDRNEDSEDISLVYITTHGSPLGFDIPPFDEEDNTDEILLSYWGFAYPGLFLYDDELNVLLNRLESKGVCFIVDSCYAGGFNDPPDWNFTYNSFFPYPKQTVQMSSSDWIKGFGEELRGQNRVVLMASCEDEVSYSGGFAPYLIDGLRGYADSNKDNIITAEEAFYYTQPRTSRQSPTMYDGYEGDLPLIDISEGIKDNSRDNVQKVSNKPLPKNPKESNLASPENSIICGFVQDNETSEFIEDVTVYVRGRDNEWDFFENETTSDSNGYYSINVPESRCSMTVYAQGYLSDRSGFLEIEENEILWQNYSLNPLPPENSRIFGYIIEQESNDPIIGANISLFWENDQDQYYINETTSDIDGYYNINVATGKVEIEVEASGYFRESERNIDVADFEELWVNFSLHSKPIENSILCGYLIDEDTSEPINNARITIEWVDADFGHEYENETHSDSNGFYSINVASGELYVDVREQGYEYYDPYRHDCDEDTIQWLNITLEDESIDVDIAKPLKALYLNNQRIIPFSRARIIGPIDIEVDVYESWFDQGNAERVELYIDDELTGTLIDPPYVWTWDKKTFGKHTIKAIAYDYEGNSVSDEVEIYKFL